MPREFIGEIFLQALNSVFFFRRQFKVLTQSTNEFHDKNVCFFDNSFISIKTNIALIIRVSSRTLVPRALTC